MSQAAPEARSSPRRGGRVGRRQARDAATPDRRIYRRLRNPYPPIEVLSEDQVEAIHDASMTILEELGIRVRLPEARQILKQAGATVDEAGEIVRFGRDFVDETMATAPEVVTLHARNPDATVETGKDKVAIATVGGPPNVSDLEYGRRSGTLEDFRNFMRLAQTYDVIHILGPAAEPMDIEMPFRHLEMTGSMLTLTDKIPFVYCRGAPQVADALEMIRIGRRIPREDFAGQVSCFTVVNANSPLQLDVPMGQGIIDFARAGQLMVLTPFTLAGAMAPVSLAGALAQQNAEALAGLTLAQCVRPGAPVSYGGFTSNVDMKSGAPAFGTSDYVMAAFASGQLARRYRIPFRSSNVNASNTPDAQAAYESQMSLWGSLMGGCNLMMHGAGWLEGGLTASFEKFIIDVDMLQMMANLFQGIAVDEASLGLDAVREVGHGGHYFGAAHTLERYSQAFYDPLVSDWRNYETWSENGSPDTAQRAHKLYKQVLADFQPPPQDPAVREELDAFVERRKREGGAPPES